MRLNSFKQPLFLLIAIFLFGCNQNSKTPNQNDKPEKLTADKPIIKKEFQNGDIIFHTSMSTQSLAIQIATKSKYSHVGMIFKNGEKLFVFEAVQPVKLTPLKQFIKRGKDGHYVLKRLKNRDQVLTPEAIAKMKATGKKYLGKNYDLQFKWSDSKIYCSELVWKVYKEVFNVEIGQLQQFKDFDLSNEAVQAKAKERYGDNIPMDELVITPDRMFQSDQLITVMEK